MDVSSVQPSTKKVVYIAGPYSPREKRDGVYQYTEIDANIMAARFYALKVWAAGGIALCPHLNSHHMGIEIGDPGDLFYSGDLALLKRCDAIFMIENWQHSKGAHLEHQWAKAWGMPIFYDLQSLKNWLNHIQ